MNNKILTMSYKFCKINFYLLTLVQNCAETHGTSFIYTITSHMLGFLMTVNINFSFIINVKQKHTFGNCLNFAHLSHLFFWPNPKRNKPT